MQDAMIEYDERRRSRTFFLAISAGILALFSLVYLTAGTV